MNTNPKAKRILCYGESIVWGRIPGDDNTVRYQINKRWTGILQNLLGNGYEVIEEGLNGRTTNLESPHKTGKNGAKYLFSCLETHKPLDLIILSLGKNDLKAKYNTTPESICDGIEACLQIIYEEGKTISEETPKIILVSPCIIQEKERLRFGKKEIDFLGAKGKSEKLGKMYLKIAEKHNIDFLDLAQYVKVSEIDGVHLDENEHRKIADIMYQKVIKLLSI
ncbi:MAG: G-D-S-L family lipolytic protein [Parcubacteria group bacterium GW2011_GWA2_39_18]|nr:MAG: G-D-S-L family lipolytic protein [Parcubacteria group bacterium GW2011_GWA2_39_18]